jgi:hypothetical protein
LKRFFLSFFFTAFLILHLNKSLLRFSVRKDLFFRVERHYILTLLKVMCMHSFVTHFDSFVLAVLSLEQIAFFIFSVEGCSRWQLLSVMRRCLTLRIILLFGRQFNITLRFHTLVLWFLKVKHLFVLLSVSKVGCFYAFGGVCCKCILCLQRILQRRDKSFTVCLTTSDLSCFF